MDKEERAEALYLGKKYIAVSPVREINTVPYFKELADFPFHDIELSSVRNYMYVLW